MPNTEIKDLHIEEESRCKIDETLESVRCNLLGEVTHKGVFVCKPHARLLEAKDRSALLRGIVSTLDLCLKSLSVRRDSELLETLRFERAEAAQGLAQTREDLRLAEINGPECWVRS